MDKRDLLTDLGPDCECHATSPVFVKVVTDSETIYLEVTDLYLTTTELPLPNKEEAIVLNTQSSSRAVLISGAKYRGQAGNTGLRTDYENWTFAKSHEFEPVIKPLEGPLSDEQVEAFREEFANAASAALPLTKRQVDVQWDTDGTITEVRTSGLPQSSGPVNKVHPDDHVVNTTAFGHAGNEPAMKKVWTDDRTYTLVPQEQIPASEPRPATGAEEYFAQRAEASPVYSAELEEARRRQAGEAPGDQWTDRNPGPGKNVTLGLPTVSMNPQAGEIEAE